jgi:serine/threonine protein kinase
MDGRQPILHTGQIIHKQYRVVNLLGKGASGAVYLVTDERSPQKYFALKEVIPAVRGEKRGLPFDGATLKQLSHPALPQIHRLFHSDKPNRYYLLVDYVEGSNLEVMRQLMPGKRFSLPTAMSLMSPIMDAVSYLHQHHPHLIHGDIKPSNIIAPIAGTLTSAKLVDFGGLKDAFIDSAAEQGVHNFRAPEQYSKTATRRTDVYALGAIFYTILTGVAPTAASERVARIEAGDPDPLLPMSRFTSSGQIVAQAIHQALSISRHDRFVSVEEFRQALWRVMYANRGAISTPEIGVFVPVDERAQLEGNPTETASVELPALVSVEKQEEILAAFDNSLPEKDVPASMAQVAIHEEKASQAEASPRAEASSAPPFSFAVTREATPPAGISASEGTTVLLNKPSRMHSGSGRHSTSRKRKAKTYSLIVRFLLLTCLLGSAIAIVGYQLYSAKYQNEEALAQTGIKHLQTAAYLMQAWAKKPLDATSVTQARHEFVVASVTFAQLETDLQPYSGIGTSMPGIGPRVSATVRIVSVAMKIAQAGVTGCDGLSLVLSRLHEPFGRGRGLTLGDIAMVGGDLHKVETIVNQATAEINSLQAGDVQFDARVAKAVVAFHRYLPTLQSFLHQTDQLLPILPSLLGIRAPAFYLVEILDPTEQRPGGGAIKDYGFATFIGGRLSTAHITDVNLLDAQFVATGRTLPLPAAYSWFDLAAQSWNLHDSNLDADFPTAASYAQQNYNHEGGRVPLQGVIAITPALMAQVLSITGPISVPELHETVTSQNLLERIHHYELGSARKAGSALVTPQGSSSGSRYFTELLAQRFLARFHEVRGSMLPQLFLLLGTSMRTKDLQIYFNAEPAENLLRLAHIDAAIPAVTDDTIFVVDANIAGDTANQFISSTMDDQVTIDGKGNAMHRTAIRYSWSKNGKLFGSPLYRDYTRIYAPPGSVLQRQEGWESRGASRAFGREVWAGFFTLSPDQTNTITLTWTVKGVAKKDAAGWHYQYLVQRQAGTYWKLNVQITLPSCAARTHTSGGLIFHKGHSTSLSQSLSEDTNLGIDYSC